MTITKEEVQKLLDGATPGPVVLRKDRTIAAYGVPILRGYAGRNWQKDGPLFAAAPDIATFALAESARADQAEARLDRHLSIFADHAAVVWGIIRAAGDLPTLNDGPFKDGFITGMEEVAARGDIQAADGNHQLQELCEQIIALVTGEATLIMAKPEVVVQKMAAEAERDTLAAANAALEARVAELRAMIRVNMLRYGPPGTSHEEINAAIDAALASGKPGEAGE